MSTKQQIETKRRLKENIKLLKMAANHAQEDLESGKLRQINALQILGLAAMCRDDIVRYCYGKEAMCER